MGQTCCMCPFHSLGVHHQPLREPGEFTPEVCLSLPVPPSPREDGGSFPSLLQSWEVAQVPGKEVTQVSPGKLL